MKMVKFSITLLATAVAAAAPASAALHTVNFTGNFASVGNSQTFTSADVASLSVTFNASDLVSHGVDGNLHEVTVPGAAFSMTVGGQSRTLADYALLIWSFTGVGVSPTGEYMPVFNDLNAAGASVMTQFLGL
jgi:hypothetical protein